MLEKYQKSLIFEEKNLAKKDLKIRLFRDFFNLYS